MPPQKGYAARPDQNPSGPPARAFLSEPMATEKLPPLERYIRMLELLTAFPDGLALSELSAMIELPKASAHRLIKTLQELELAATSSPGSATYVTGPRLRKLAFMSADAQWVVAILRPFLRELTQEMGETAFVARLEGASVRTIAFEAPETPWRGFILPGYEMHPNAAASAKAILAFQDAATLKRALREPFEKLTPQTNLSKERLLEEYAAIRQSGVATCIGEIDEGLAAVAVPIEVGGAAGLYSLGLTGPMNRVMALGVERAAERMMAYAARMASGLSAGLSAESARAAGLS